MTRPALRPLPLAIAFLLSTVPAPAAPSQERTEPSAAPLQPELAALRPFVGKTWKAPFDAEKKVYDVARWEAALGGRVVRGDAGGVTEVEATMELLPDGRMKVSSRMLRNGAWKENPPRLYEEDPAAKAVLP